MKRKYLSILLVVCMVFTMLPTKVFAAEGDPAPALHTLSDYANAAVEGTDYTMEGTTLTIKTAKGAAYWSASGSAYLNYNIRLDADIDVSGFPWTPVGSTDGMDHSPAFTGSFDGQGHTISGLNYANDLQITGVIGAINGGSIKNLTVSGSIGVTHEASGWTGKFAYHAGIVGIASDSVITNCHSGVQITSNVTNLTEGGIAATVNNNVIIDGCTNSGAISGSAISMNFMGGITGDMEVLTASSSIKNCANTGNLTANAAGEGFNMISLGGIVGNKMDNTQPGDQQINASVENCYNTGALDATSGGINYVGGISGNNAGESCESISNCYNIGAVSGSAIMASLNAGIVGTNDPGSVYSCYWKADSAASCVQTGGLIHNCGTFDSTGNLSDTTDDTAGTENYKRNLIYGSDLLNALNGWAKAHADSGYCKWRADSTTSPVNGGYPVFDIGSTATTFDFCNGAADVNMKPSVNPTWGTTGYTFAGWYTKPNGEGSQLMGSGVAGITYYAKWTVGNGANIKTVRTTALDLRNQNTDKDKLSTEGWAWYSSVDTALNHTAKTLVLSGLTLNTLENTALIVPDGTTIMLMAGTTNSIKGGDVTSDTGNVSVYGIYGAGALTLQGSGILNVISGTATCTNDGGNYYLSRSAGIYSTGNMLISDTVTINATGGDANSLDEEGNSYGVDCEGTLTIQNGTVTGVGGKAAATSSIGDTYSYGIFAKSLKIINGTVTGYGAADTNVSYGIGCKGLKIDGGTVAGYGGSGKVWNSEGIYSLLPTTITDGVVTAVGGAANGYANNGTSIGIFSVFGYKITGGVVTATGGMANYETYGILSVDEATILGGTVEGIASNAGTGSYGICGTGQNVGGAITLTITGGRVTAKCGTAADMAAIFNANRSDEAGSSAKLTIGSTVCPALIANAMDGTTAITRSSGTIASGKLLMSGSDAVRINFPGNTVTFNANGGSVTPSTANTGEDGRLVSLPIPSHGGSYSFDGWFTAADGGTSVTVSNVFNADTTLYAHWSYTSGGTTIGGDSYTLPADNTPKTKDNTPVEVTAVSNSNGNASVTVTQEQLNEILKAIQQSATNQGEAQNSDPQNSDAHNSVSENGIIAKLTVNTPGDAKSLTVTLPKEVQDALLKEQVAGLEIISNAIEITFDQTALGTINKTAGTDIQITAKPSEVQSESAREVIGNRPMIDLTLSYGDRTMSSFGGGNVRVGIPYTLGNEEQIGNIAAVYVDEMGKVTWLTKSTYDAARKMVILVTPHFSTYGVAYKSDAPKFKDIAEHWAKDDIQYVVSRGLLSGTAKGKFSPDSPITRATLVTALGRMAQVDVSKYKKSSFLDVSNKANYKGYIEWANKKGILKGISSKKYAPNSGITHEQLAAMLERYATATGFKLPASQAQNTIDPKKKATRAEVSAMLKSIMELSITSGHE